MGIISFIKDNFKKITNLLPQSKEKTAYHPGNYNNTGYNNYFGTDQGGGKWPYSLSGDGRTRVMDHYLMRQNARDAYHDSIDARAIVESFADNVVDTGLVLDAMPNYNILNITPERAEEWSREVNERFHLYAKDKKQHRSGSLSFYQAQRMYEIFQHRDNDMFIRLYYSKSKKLQNSLQWEFLDPNQIRGWDYTNTYAQYGCDDGIIKNPDGTEKAYKIWITKPDKPGEYEERIVNRIGEKSGKVNMIHGFNPEYAGQTRGYSRLGFALQELENITDFSLAVIKKAINHSNMVLSVENMQQTPGNALEGIISDMNTSVTGAPIVTTTPTPEEIEYADSRINGVKTCPIPEAGLESPGSMAVVGNEQGDTIRLLENKAPGESYKDFVGAFLERLCAATGNPVEVVLKKFGQNYSASRATLVLAWRTFQLWREEIAVDFLNVIYEAWLGEEIAAGRISAPGFSDPRLRAAWLNCSWIGSRMPEIDPTKEANARKLNLEMNLTHGERESRNLNGSSFSDNIAKNTKTFPEMAQPYWVSSNNNTVSEDKEEKEEDDKNGGTSDD